MMSAEEARQAMPRFDLELQLKKIAGVVQEEAVKGKGSACIDPYLVVPKEWHPSLAITARMELFQAMRAAGYRVESSSSNSTYIHWFPEQ